MALARVIGGPASGITNEEAVEAARFRDDLKIQKCDSAGLTCQAQSRCSHWIDARRSPMQCSTSVGDLMMCTISTRTLNEGIKS